MLPDLLRDLEDGLASNLVPATPYNIGEIVAEDFRRRLLGRVSRLNSQALAGDVGDPEKAWQRAKRVWERLHN